MGDSIHIPVNPPIPPVQPHSWRDHWAGTVRIPDDQVRFVDTVGCCTINPLPRYLDFPSQAVAMGTTNAIGETWFWKDDLHTERRIFYTRLFGGQPGFISYALLPAFIATNGAVADELLHTGAMPPPAREIYHLIQEQGPIAIRVLKRQLTPDAKRLAARLLIDLERQFIITKIGITGRERGTYGYIWDLTERWMPAVLAAADRLGRAHAGRQLRDHLAAFGILPDAPFYQRVLGWAP